MSTLVVQHTGASLPAVLPLPARGDRAPSTLAKFQAPEVVFGPGALAEAAYALSRLGARRPFVVTDPGMLAAGRVDELVGGAPEAGLRPVLWHGVTGSRRERYRPPRRDGAAGPVPGHNRRPTSKADLAALLAAAL